MPIIYSLCFCLTIGIGYFTAVILFLVSKIGTPITSPFRPFVLTVRLVPDFLGSGLEVCRQENGIRLRSCIHGVRSAPY